MMDAHQFVQPNHIVLDISAGQAMYKPFFAHGTYVALDSRVGDASWDYSKLDIVADAMHLPIRDSSIDVALNFVSLEHYPEPWQFFREAARVLKPGGKLFLFAPHLYPEHQIPHDYYRYTQFALRDLCTRNGLIAEAVTPVCSIFYTATRVISFLKDTLKLMGGNEGVHTYLDQTERNLKQLSGEIDQALAALPAVREAIYQMPMQYTLRAGKPGILETDERSGDRAALLSRILADPHDKARIDWDGTSSAVSAGNGHPVYPVKSGVPDFTAVATSQG